MSPRDTFTAEVPNKIVEDPAFSDWEESLDGSLQPKVQAALDMIESEGIVTSAKDLGDGLYEKKWNSGLRLYFAVVQTTGRRTLLILGSGKGREQTRAIKAARTVLTSYSVVRESLRKQ